MSTARSCGLRTSRLSSIERAPRRGCPRDLTLRGAALELGLYREPAHEGHRRASAAVLNLRSCGHRALAAPGSQPSTRKAAPPSLGDCVRIGMPCARVVWDKVPGDLRRRPDERGSGHNPTPRDPDRRTAEARRAAPRETTMSQPNRPVCAASARLAAGPTLAPGERVAYVRSTRTWPTFGPSARQLRVGSRSAPDAGPSGSCRPTCAQLSGWHHEDPSASRRAGPRAWATNSPSNLAAARKAGVEAVFPEGVVVTTRRSASPLARARRRRPHLSLGGGSRRECVQVTPQWFSFLRAASAIGRAGRFYT